jgi:CheY-like chemotaxis protein
MEALAMVQQEPIDLVLTDVMMPLMDGFTLLKALRYLHPPPTTHTPLFRCPVPTTSGPPVSSV